MSWLKKILMSTLGAINEEKNSSVPDGLWSTCKICKSIRYNAELAKNLYVCHKCGFHERISARLRVSQIIDIGDTTKELFSDITSVDPLKFKDSKKYTDRIEQARQKTNENEAVLVFSGYIKGLNVVCISFDFRFMGGSMGSKVGEKFVLAIEYAINNKLPVICFSASGGARMQEGMFSLMQMMRTSSILSQLDESKLPYISILTDPTMGGVSASLAMLGDIIIAEPNALIGFAGPRVIEQTVRQKLPDGFQKSEFLLENGHIDKIVDRRELKKVLFSLLSSLTFYN